MSRNRYNASKLSDWPTVPYDVQIALDLIAGRVTLREAIDAYDINYGLVGFPLPTVGSELDDLNAKFDTVRWSVTDVMSA